MKCSLPERAMFCFRSELEIGPLSWCSLVGGSYRASGLLALLRLACLSILRMAEFLLIETLKGDSLVS